MGAATSEACSKHVGECVKIVKGGAFESGGKSFTENGVVGCIAGHMGYVYFEVLVEVGFSRIAVQCEGFPLSGERCVGDNVNERVAASRWLAR